MSKYTEEFKLKVVKYCLEENHSRSEAEKYFSIPKKIQDKNMDTKISGT